MRKSETRNDEQRTDPDLCVAAVKNCYIKNTAANFLRVILLGPLISLAQTDVVVVPLGGEDPPTKYVFVTEGVWTGDLGGPEGADAKCQAEADAEESLVKGRTFMAWISGGLANDFSIDGSGRNFARNHGPYRQPTGLLVARSYNDLITNGPTNAIREHADGSTGTSTIGTFAWTGILSNGSYSTNRCIDTNGNDWKTFEFSQFGTSGEDSALQNWTSGQSYACNLMLAIYCFEQ